MLCKKLARGVFYNTQKKLKHRHSDNRDVYNFVTQLGNNTDSERAFGIFYFNTRQQLLTWSFILGCTFYTVHKSKSLREKFDIKYLTQLPPKDFDADDYDYKFWEVAITTPNEEYGQVINTDTASKGKYVLLYHGSTTDSHLAMQRFARLKQHMLLRKHLALESVFVCMDFAADPSTVNQYVGLYSEDIIPTVPGDEQNRLGLMKVFQNIGCIYLLDKDSGNVIFIIDPNKHPLDALSNRVIYNISKHEDLKISREMLNKNIDIRTGNEAELAYKAPTY